MKKVLFLLVIGFLAVSAANAADIFVESTATGQNYASYSETGPWSPAASKSTAPGGLTGTGSRYASCLYGGRYATFTFPSTETAGAYNVYITHGAQTNRRTHCKVDITHNGGVETVNYDQTLNTNGWVLLGSFALTPGTSKAKLYYDPSAYESGNLMADAVKFSGPLAETPTHTYTPSPIPTMTPGVGDIYVESRAAGQNNSNYTEYGGFGDSTEKSTASGLTPGIGSRYYSMSFPNKTARFALPTPQVPGIYDVAVSHPAGTINGRWWVSSQAGKVGGTAHTLDQAQNANTWVNVGQYELRPGYSYVEVGTVQADADQSGNFLADSARFTGPLPTWTPTPTATDTPTATNTYTPSSGVSSFEAYE